MNGKYLGLFVLLPLAGCVPQEPPLTITDGGPRDLAVPGTPDLAMVASTDLAGSSPDLLLPYAAATVHQIDTDPGNGPFGNGKYVSLAQVVAVTDVDKYVNSTNQQCRYQIWVQDPACATPPCGMVVKAIGPKAPNPNSTGKDCPAARLSGTVLASIARGDNVSIAGKLVFEVDSLPPMNVVEHQLFAETIKPLANDKSIAPLVISDTATYAQFVSHTGAGFDRYEGMYVTIQPDKGLLQVTAFNGDGFQTIPGNMNWGDTFDSDYYPMGAPSFPAVGSTWHAISGVVSTRHGGELMPIRNKDFVP